MPIVEIDGRPLSPAFATVILGNRNLIAGLSEHHAPPLTAVDFAGVAFVHAFERLDPTRDRCRRAEDAATIVLVLHGRVVRAAGWPADPCLAACVALNWWRGPRAPEALARAQAIAPECTLIPDLWRQRVLRTQSDAFNKAARTIERRRQWTTARHRCGASAPGATALAGQARLRPAGRAKSPRASPEIGRASRRERVEHLGVAGAGHNRVGVG